MATKNLSVNAGGTGTITAVKPTDILGLYIYNSHANTNSVVTISCNPVGAMGSLVMMIPTVEFGNTLILGKDELMLLDVDDVITILVTGGGPVKIVVSYNGSITLA
jgi:hypothetical protein